MSYRVPADSRNVLLPVLLEDRATGGRLNEAFSRAEIAGAMVISTRSAGGIVQDFHPLKLTTLLPTERYSGEDWQLCCHRGPAGLFSYFLGIPDRHLTSECGYSSVSVEIVGSPPLSDAPRYSGGVDVHIDAPETANRLPAFLNLCERFFPALLPPGFIDRHRISLLPRGSAMQALLRVELKLDPRMRLPMSFGREWQARHWMGCWAENLLIPGNAAVAVVSGGCFQAPDGTLSHWFAKAWRGDEASYRRRIQEHLAAASPSSQGAWLFSLDLLDTRGRTLSIGPDSWDVGDESESTRPIGLRHALLPQMLWHNPNPDAPGPTQHLKNRLGVLPERQGEALEALRRMAGLLYRHQNRLELLSAAKSGASGGWASHADLRMLESEVDALTAEHAEILAVLEDAFDAVQGFGAWDAIHAPVRDWVGSLLAEEPSA